MNRNEFISNKKDQIIKLIKVSGLMDGMRESIDKYVDTLIKNLQEQGLNIKQHNLDSMFAILKEEFYQAINDGELEKMIVRAYDKSLDEKDVVALINFYNDESVKKLLPLMKTINMGLMEIGAEWFKRRQGEMMGKINTIIAQKLAEERSREVRTTGIAATSPFADVSYTDRLYSARPGDSEWI